MIPKGGRYHEADVTIKSAQSHSLTTAIALFFLIGNGPSMILVANVIHDAEYYILKGQNEKKWAAEDQALEAKLAELKKKHGQPPNIVYILWDDMTFGAVGFPGFPKKLWLHHAQHQSNGGRGDEFYSNV